MCDSTDALFFFTHTATTDIYTLSLHDALPILARATRLVVINRPIGELASDPKNPRRHSPRQVRQIARSIEDRKSTRLNSSHLGISYAVFCLKKKKNRSYTTQSAIVTNTISHMS